MVPLVWVAIGLALGLLAAVSARSGPGLVADVLLGLLGAFLGGWMATTFAPDHGTGALLAAGVAAVLLLLSVHGPRQAEA